MVLWMFVYASSTCVSIFLSILIYYKLRSLNQNTTSEANHHSLDQQQATHGPNSAAKHEAFITISCLCVASICCRLPFPLVGMLLITIIERSFGLVVMSWTLAVVVLLLYLVFVVDPVIYLLRMPEVRSTMCSGVHILQKHVHGCSYKQADSHTYKLVQPKCGKNKENVQISAVDNQQVMCTSVIETAQV